MSMMSIQTPDWVKQAIFYQIFPDRFARSTRTQHVGGITLKAWGTPPQEQGYQGGDLLGIVDKLDYLQELGVTALYLNPVFSSASNHRYHTYDYFEVDPLLGGKDALRELLDEAHNRDMRIVLDAVFNHASRGFWPFHHILENGSDSPYLDWFIVRNWPLRPYSSDEKKPLNYDAWWGLPALPKLNFDNSGVRDYFLEVARYWIEFGIDGWRLDVPEEIEDAAFWQAFRATVKGANRDAYIVGEIWHEAQEWLQGDRFDAVMNYVFSRSAFGFFASETLRTDYEPGGYLLKPLDAQTFATSIENMVALHPWEVTQTQLNLLDSHDTARVSWIVGEDKSAHQLCVLFQMTMPGAPCIYYGDEVGMTGATDPDCRGAFPWHDENQWDLELLTFHRNVVALRRDHPVLALGNYQTLYADQGIYAFRRNLDTQMAIVVFNVNLHQSTVDLRIPGLSNGSMVDGCRFKCIWPEKNNVQHLVCINKQMSLTIPARSALVLIN